MPFDERERRRPGFDPDSEPVRFCADGPELFLPIPRVSFRARLAGGRLAAERHSYFGKDFDRLADAIDAAETDQEYIEALMNVALDLLRRNYDATDEELAELIVFEGKHREMPECWLVVNRLAKSLPPKASAPGPSPDS